MPGGQSLYVVMRSHNDMPLISQTLDLLAAQKRSHRLLAFDNASTDGTTDALRRRGARIVHVPAGQYVPGRVLNEGMRCSEGEIVVFLNSDCTPSDDEWLGNLLAGFTDERVAAVFGRQVARENCHPLFMRDTEDTYGDGSRQSRWRHCFSMAACAIRRAVWERWPFDETLAYSEDIEWTWRVRQKGFEIGYVADAVVVHSHNYSAAQFYRRQFGEARAEARIFTWSPWQRSFVRYALLPYVRQVLSDFKYCVSRGRLDAVAWSPVLRLAGIVARWKGLRRGLREERSDAVRAAR